jgi:thiamine-monophosphate kinase
VDEFQSIAELFAPLAIPEAAGLKDDAAFIQARPGWELVVTTDAVVEGVHFLPGTPPELVARKLLRVNLSDLAAKGAEPFGYQLAVAWPPGWGREARAAFAGGDTVATPGPLTASITALGYAPAGRAVRRSGARPGDLVLVSGVIGDGWLGLQAAKGELHVGQAHLAALRARYELPEPRLQLTPALREHAHSALDVSDGLVADLAHLASASDVNLGLELDDLPLALAGRAWLDGQTDPASALERLASGGDDYEIAFTIRPEALSACQADALLAGVPVTVIGRVMAGSGLTVSYQGEARQPARTGWRHS